MFAVDQSQDSGSYFHQLLYLSLVSAPLELSVGRRDRHRTRPCWVREKEYEVGGDEGL